MKIIKHTFKLPKLEIVEGELLENGYSEETYTFTLLHKGIGLFEELSGKPLMSYLATINVDDEKSLEKFLSKDFIPNLACASYVKIEDNKFHNNRATAEEFKKTLAYPRCGEDLEFVKKLTEMAVECITGELPKGESKKGNNSKN